MTRDQVRIRFLRTIEYWRNRELDEHCTHGLVDNCFDCLTELCVGTMMQILHWPDNEPVLDNIRWQPVIKVSVAPVDDESKTCADCNYSYLTVAEAQECLRRHKADMAYRT